jgi:hypothetical protein
VIRLLPLLLLTSCGGSGSAGIPPCNAIIWMFGSADLTFDCPAVKAIPLLERRPPP